MTHSLDWLDLDDLVWTLFEHRGECRSAAGLATPCDALLSDLTLRPRRTLWTR